MFKLNRFETGLSASVNGAYYGLRSYVHLPFLATLRSIKIAIFGNFWTALLPFLAILDSIITDENAKYCHFWQL